MGDKTVSIGWQFSHRELCQRLREKGWKAPYRVPAGKGQKYIRTNKGVKPTKQQREYATTCARTLTPTSSMRWQSDRGWVYHMGETHLPRSSERVTSRVAAKGSIERVVLLVEFSDAGDVAEIVAAAARDGKRPSEWVRWLVSAYLDGERE